MIIKSLFLLKITFFFLFLIGNNDAFSQYKISQIVEENKFRIERPYKYDGFLMKEFSFDLINKNIPLEFVAFEKQKYQLYFCASKFEEQVLVSIYNKAAPTIKVAEKLLDQHVSTWVYEPTKAGTYTIVYEIPPSNTDVEHKACIIMLIAFK